MKGSFKSILEKHYPLLLFFIYAVPYSWSLIWYKESPLLILGSLILLLALTFLIHFITLKYKKGSNGIMLSAILIWLFLNLQFLQNTLQSIADKLSLQFRYPALGALILVCLVIYLLAKSTTQYKTTSRLLAYFSLFFLLTTTISRVYSYTKKEEYLFTKSNNLPINLIKEKPDLDIYYFVFDSYTSSESLKKYYQFDNSALQNYLQAKGFKVIKNSKTKYDSTPLCLSSVFGMDTLSNLDQFKPYEEEVNLRALNLSVGNSYVFQAFKKAQLDCYAFSIFPVESSHNKKIVWDLSWWSSLTHIFSGTALKYPYVAYWMDSTSSDEKIELAFNSNLSKQNKAALYFYHFYAPHHSYKFNHILYNKSYQERIAYTNQRIMRIVDKIFAANKRPFTIIIQGDHGSREIEPGNLRHPERYTVMNAIYLPDGNYREISSDFSPLNTFRLILNRYYGTNLPLLDSSN